MKICATIDRMPVRGLRHVAGRVVGQPELWFRIVQPSPAGEQEDTP